MEIHHCENPVCRFVTRHAVPDMCPLCGGAFFLPSDGSDLVAADWVALGIESKTDGRFDDAFSDFEKAAAEGDAAGQCMLGLAYETGEGVAQSWPDAVLLYRAAAGQGHAQAQCNLGWCYEFGKGVELDEPRAVELYRAAAEQGWLWKLLDFKTENPDTAKAFAGMKAEMQRWLEEHIK